MKRKKIVSLILEKNNKFLVEKRKKSKFVVPGTIIFPAGHVENGESNENALIREVKEELGIIIKHPKFITYANFDCEEKQIIYWYSCEKFEGEIINNEAESLFWISIKDINKLTHEISKNALLKYTQKILE